MTSAQPDARTARFPDLAVRSLAGDDLVLPRDLMAPRALLICAFRQWHQQLVDDWITWATTEAGVAPSPLDLDPASSSVVLEVPVLSRAFRPARGFIDGGMASSIRVPVVLARTLTAYTDVSAFCRAARIATTATVTAFVLTRDGAVLAQVTGPADPSRCAVVAAALVSGLPA
ncbi:hypothetical protein [Pengzhenrongella phosphoraccumulans]|uniref:hypothetical protein n=1 Tax=Pengzhenrongella phosphoraccumulans TaxID=3114394 RepID=UPI00388FB316